MKFCKDCKYFQESMAPDGPFCTHINSIIDPDMVRGITRYTQASRMRHYHWKCGTEAIFFEEKPAKKSLWIRLMGG